MEITENKEILQKLYDQQKVLVERLKHTRSAIIGLGGVVSNEELQDLLEVEEEKQAKKPLLVPDKYEKNMPFVSKIAFTIRELGGEAYVTDVVDRLWEMDQPTGIEKDILKRNITMLMSYLYRDGRLKARKDGNRYKYLLII